MFSTGQKLRTVETRVCIGILYSKRPSLFIPWKISCYSDVIYVEENLGGVAKGGGSGAIALLMLKFARAKFCLSVDNYVLSVKETDFYNQEFTRKAIALKISQYTISEFRKNVLYSTS